MVKKKVAKKVTKKKGPFKPKVGRPRTYLEKKTNRTIRLSDRQVKLIYDHYETLQAFFEAAFSKLEKKVEQQEAKELNLIA
jgi:hypothetical protein